MSDHLLTIENLSAGYDGATVLRDINLEIPSQGVTLLGGRNGAGKTTLLKTLMGLLVPQSGTITFQDKTLSDQNRGMNPVEIARAGLGYVPETRRVFASLTVLENLEAGRRKGPGPDWTVDGVTELFPPLASLMQRRAGTLSGGEQQMLSIARTLMGRPKLLLLDEASEGLAPLIVKSLADALKQMASTDLSIVMAEQNWRFASDIADRIVVLDHGTIAYDDTMTAFNADSTAQSRLLGASGDKEVSHATN